ncbi:BLUF domain protein [Maricaulis maris MCS10]|uniref:BLUF domain protein n=1 Tax=Maricaulis maris (strain MCS10) TaxID=394221 RepID=Q0ALH8_MARMM|nr:BLUF domain-containing protein [Maricaulis maris]ABI66865.1 BLUF domain protein [Maricaulis maris MCS10]
MLLSRLTFFSRRAWKVGADPAARRVLEDILAAGRRNNPARGITGVLVVDDDMFIQVLEGPRARITETFLRIASDPRHCDLVLAGMAEIDERRFDTWQVYVRRLPGDIRWQPWFRSPEVVTSAGFLEQICSAMRSGDVLQPV